MYIDIYIYIYIITIIYTCEDEYTTHGIDLMQLHTCATH